MRILEIVLPDASEFDKKCQRVDFAALSATHEVVVRDSARDAPDADVAHIYGPSAHIRLSIPYVASSAPPKSRFRFRRTTQPAALTTPSAVPEAVEECYFARSENQEPRTENPLLVASFRRPSIRNIVEQTVHRIARFRDDVTWNLFERPPAPHDLAGVDVWVDPAVDDQDFDGFVAEALVTGNKVVASRTAINVHRLEKGRTGFLVPRNDPNELTHAILAALFKPEVALSKLEAAKQTAGKFRPRQRSRVLEHLYETVIR